MKDISNNQKQIKVGVIGLGVGEQHLIGYLNNKSCLLKKVCDIDKEKINYYVTIETETTIMVEDILDMI